MTHKRLWASAAACLLSLSVTASAATAIPPGWEKQDVNLRLSGTRQIKAIYHPAAHAPAMLKDRKSLVPPSKKLLYPLNQEALTADGQLAPALVSVVNSPPVDGFIPWITIVVTNANAGDGSDTIAVPESAVTGSYLTPALQNSYVIGLFDTGASAHLMGYDNSSMAGLYSSGLVTDSAVPLQGATGTVTGLASYPIGVFAGGLGAIEPNGFLQRTSGMKGQSNVSIVVGQPPAPGAPDLPTAMGAPLAVFYSVAIDNENKVSRTPATTEYRGPAISFYQPLDPAIPAFNDSSIVLQSRPAGASSVNFFPTFDYGTFDFYPLFPSVVGDFFSVPQSLFFVSAVNIADGGYPFVRYTGFMFDTGAQITVIGSAVAADMGLNTNNPDFQVEIQDVTGQTTLNPGFYLDNFNIAATGAGPLQATHVPVVLLDVQSPEGGFLDGIVGMNLFTGFNMVFRGGNFSDPAGLDFKLITKIADISPAGGDGKVNGLDLLTMAAAWLATPGSANWNASADIAPAGGDGIVNFRDLAVLTGDWGWVRGQ